MNLNKINGFKEFLSLYSLSLDEEMGNICTSSGTQIYGHIFYQAIELHNAIDSWIN